MNEVIKSLLTPLEVLMYYFLLMIRATVTTEPVRFSLEEFLSAKPTERGQPTMVNLVLL